jgi:hypothetical protein
MSFQVFVTDDAARDLEGKNCDRGIALDLSWVLE